MKRRSKAKKAARRSKAKKGKVGAGKARGIHRKASRKAARQSSRKAKPLRKKATRSQKSSQRRTASSSAKKPSQGMMFEPLEQVTVACSNCGRQFNIVKLHGLSMEGMICQRCSIGEVQFPEA